MATAKRKHSQAKKQIGCQERTGVRDRGRRGKRVWTDQTARDIIVSVSHCRFEQLHQVPSSGRAILTKDCLF